MKRHARSTHPVVGLHHPMISPAHSNPLVLFWRWRYELTLLLGLPLTLVVLIATLGLNWTIFIVIAAIILLGGLPAARRQLVARAWCVLTPHRLRAGCARAWIHNRRGRLPAILWCAPKPYGEQVLVWCPAGLTVDDLIAARQVLASACYASEIEVIMHPKYRHLATLEVIRYQEFEPEDQVPQRLHWVR